MKSSSIMKKLKAAAIGSAMADMALLLLIFFMATTTTEPPKGVEVELPRGKAQGAEQDSLYISVSRQGRYYFDGREVSLEALAEQLQMRGGEKDQPVAITADRTLDYQVVGALLTVLRQMDFLNIVFMAESDKEAEAGAQTEE